jgi:DNA repair ATPase RecN
VKELEREVAEIERRKRKYHCLTTRDLIHFIEEKKKRLSQLEEEIEELKKWREELEVKERDLKEVREELFCYREKASKILKEKLEKELKELSFQIALR